MHRTDPLDALGDAALALMAALLVAVLLLMVLLAAWGCVAVAAQIWAVVA